MWTDEGERGCEWDEGERARSAHQPDERERDDDACQQGEHKPDCNRGEREVDPSEHPLPDHENTVRGEHDSLCLLKDFWKMSFVWYSSMLG